MNYSVFLLYFESGMYLCILQ